MSGSVNRSPALLSQQRGATCSDSRRGRQSVQSADRAKSSAGGRGVLCICTINCLEKRDSKTNLIFFPFRTQDERQNWRKSWRSRRWRLTWNWRVAPCDRQQVEFTTGFLLLELSSPEWTLGLFWLEDVKTSFESFSVTMLCHQKCTQHCDNFVNC